MNEIWDKRLKNRYWDNIIRNFDETTVFLIFHQKTIAKKGGKSVIIKTQDQEKCRLLVILFITANGRKLLPYLLFKVKIKWKN